MPSSNNQKANDLVKSVKLFGSTVKANSKNAATELKISQRKKKFGVDYIDLIERGATSDQLKKCLLETMNEIEGCREKINQHNEKLDDKFNGSSKPGNRKKAVAVAVPVGMPTSTRQPKKTPSSGRGTNSNRARSKSPRRVARPVAQAKATAACVPNSTTTRVQANVSTAPPHKKKVATPVMAKKTATPAVATKTSRPASGEDSPYATGTARVKVTASPRFAVSSKLKMGIPLVAAPVIARPITRPAKGEDSPYGAAFAAIDDGNESSDDEGRYPDVDPSRWRLRELSFNGKAKYWLKGKQVKNEGPIPLAIEKFHSKPQKYEAMIYQKSMLDPEVWDPNDHKYTFLFREDTLNWQPIGVSPNGKYALLHRYYERCKAFPGDILPQQYRDKYTDNFSFRGRKLHSGSVKPIMPGRGMGLGDSPAPLTIIKEVDPGDIFQGHVGNCWLLSGISALADYEGAIRHLFRKTKNLDKLPMDEPQFMTVTLWDLKTWKEVDIVIDERLCADPVDNKEGLRMLGTRPSMDGELWVPYLEKALAAHCGGWDKIVGGHCSHGKYDPI